MTYRLLESVQSSFSIPNQIHMVVWIDVAISGISIVPPNTRLALSVELLLHQHHHSLSATSASPQPCGGAAAQIYLNQMSSKFMRVYLAC